MVIYSPLSIYRSGRETPGVFHCHVCHSTRRALTFGQVYLGMRSCYDQRDPA